MTPPPAPRSESFILYDIRLAWGNHPRVRFARCNTGVGWFVNGKPARKSDPGARMVRFNPKGTADLVGLIAPSGRMLMIETKSASGVQSPEQKTMQRVVTAFGGLYILARDLETVDRVLIPLVGPRVAGCGCSNGCKSPTCDKI